MSVHEYVTPRQCRVLVFVGKVSNMAVGGSPLHIPTMEEIGSKGKKSVREQDGRNGVNDSSLEEGEGLRQGQIKLGQ